MSPNGFQEKRCWGQDWTQLILYFKNSYHWSESFIFMGQWKYPKKQKNGCIASESKLVYWNKPDISCFVDFVEMIWWNFDQTCEKSGKC